MPIKKYATALEAMRYLQDRRAAGADEDELRAWAARRGIPLRFWRHPADDAVSLVLSLAPTMADVIVHVTSTMGRRRPDEHASALIRPVSPVVMDAFWKALVDIYPAIGAAVLAGKLPIQSTVEGLARDLPATVKLLRDMGIPEAWILALPKQLPPEGTMNGLEELYSAFVYMLEQIAEKRGLQEIARILPGW